MMRRSTNWLAGAAASLALLTMGIAAHAQDAGDEAAPPPPPPPPAASVRPGESRQCSRLHLITQAERRATGSAAASGRSADR